MSDDVELTSFPYPVPEYGAEAYWHACNEEYLVMQRCEDCNRLRWHPIPFCGDCGSGAFKWDRLTGKGTINTWTVVTHPVHPAAIDKVPYVVAIIELDEQAGLTMVSNLIDCDPDVIAIGQRVSVKFVEHPHGQKIPVFRIIATSSP